MINKKQLIMSMVAWVGALSALSAQAQDEGPKRVDVEQLKKQYWNDESQYEVVQNRLFPKKNRLELQIYGGSVASDPFQSTLFGGVTLGFHFSEYVSVHALLNRDLSTPSTALRTLEGPPTFSTTNTNPLNWTYGGEVLGSLIYGKLSLLGKAILYYDLHVLGGGGIVKTDSGDYFAQWAGIGQQIYLARWIALRIDYRLFHYYEELKQRVPGATGYPGGSAGFRDNWSHTLNLGFSVFLF